MKMVNMKVEAEKPKPETMAIGARETGPAYPYGLRLYLCESDLQKLGITELPEIGATMTIQAKVEVTSLSSNENKLYGESRSMELQITDLALGSKAESKE